MKIYPQDPRLTAFLLDELDPAETHKIRKAIAADPALQETIADLNLARADLAASLAFSANVALLPAQHAAILDEARKVDKNTKNSFFTRWRGGWMPYGISLAAAAVVALILLLKSRPEVKTAPTAQVAAPAPAPIAAPPAISPPAALPVIYANPSASASLNATEHPSLILPILKDKAGLSAITQSIRNELRLPAAEAVQFEQILNAIPLNLNAVTAIARKPKANWHPDGREAGITAHAATLGAEIIPSPWKPSAMLLLISVRGNAADSCQAKIVFHPNPENVVRYRLLGYSAPGGSPFGEGPSLLAAGSATTLAIEIDPTGSAGDFGILSWEIDGQPAPPISVKRNATSEPSDDARFAALICSFSQWLSHDNTGFLDRELLAALVRENDSETLPPERADFLSLIREALKLR